MNPNERIVVALDVPSADQAVEYIQQLVPHVGYFKLGLELLTAQQLPLVMKAASQYGAKVFIDGKFNDIPNTVAKATSSALHLGANWVNVHAMCGITAMRAAVDVANTASAVSGIERKVLAVTVLTSLSVDDFEELGMDFCGYNGKEAIKTMVCHLAAAAKSAGIHGLICSADDLSSLRTSEFGGLLKVTPGVRPSWASVNDQKRIMTPREAVAAGADYLVIGRPILNPPSGTAVEAAIRICEELSV